MQLILNNENIILNIAEDGTYTKETIDGHNIWHINSNTFINESNVTIIENITLSREIQPYKYIYRAGEIFINENFSDPIGEITNLQLVLAELAEIIMVGI